MYTYQCCERQNNKVRRETENRKGTILMFIYGKHNLKKELHKVFSRSGTDITMTIELKHDNMTVQILLIVKI